MKFKMHRTTIVGIIFTMISLNSAMKLFPWLGSGTTKSEVAEDNNISKETPQPTYNETCTQNVPEIPSTRKTNQVNKMLKLAKDGNIAVCANQTKYKSYMEDKYDMRRYDDRKISLFAVYDGHGGAYVAECAANHLLNNIHQEILQHEENNINYEEILISEIKKFDKKLEAVYYYESPFKQRSRKHIAESGSTALIGLIDEKNSKLYVANLGDAHGEMCCDDDGNLIELSKDFDLTNRPEEEKRILNANGVILHGRVSMHNYEGNLAVTRALGDYEYKATYENPIVSYEAEVKDFTLTPNLIYILFGSDGGWPRTELLEIDKTKAIDIINNNLDKDYYGAEDLCKYIEKENMSENNADNITVMVIKL